jgi:hypothetical protein
VSRLAELTHTTPATLWASSSLQVTLDGLSGGVHLPNGLESPFLAAGVVGSSSIISDSRMLALIGGLLREAAGSDTANRVKKQSSLAAVAFWGCVSWIRE